MAHLATLTGRLAAATRRHDASSVGPILDPVSALPASFPGSGRETAIRSLQAAGLEILGVKDVSPQAHNGVRQRKRRRV